MSDNESTASRKLSTNKLLILVAVVAAFGLGYYLSGTGGPRDQAKAPATTETKADTSPDQPSEQKRADIWTCSMHPQIRLPKPGKCPICFMDLVPLESQADTDDDHARHYAMSEAAKKLAEVETAEVKRETAKVVVRMVGLVEADETRIAALTSRVDGRLDEIYINFTGVRVQKGDPMVKIWSPTLIKSQVELFETIRVPGTEESVIKGSEEKLIQYGLTPDQIKEIREKKKPILYVTLRAPISGVVTKKMALLGQFVKEGSEMYIIDDLSHVWVKLAAYETDLPWIRFGQDVTFTTAAVPGRKFTGRVKFIDPMLDMKTRAVKIRVEAENPDLTLKPGMFATAEVEAEIDSRGRVIKSEWAGKYICPIHPRDEASSTPGVCPESNSALQPASSFGYADDPNPQLPLVIPASAALVTGRRAIVYVEVPGDRPMYEGREVVLGPRAGDKYVVYEGLREGERVVTKGNFKIDSAMQILARPSMMSPPKPAGAPTADSKADEEVIARLEAPEKFLEQLTPVIKRYVDLKEALVSEKVEDATKLADELANSLKSVKKAALDKKAQQAWKKRSDVVLNRLKIIAASKEIEKQRKAFDPLSEAFAKILMAFRHVMDGPLYLFHCPEAIDKQGAYWIELTKEPRNPYFGDMKVKGQDMLKCAELEETIPSQKKATDSVAGEAAEAKPAEQPKPGPAKPSSESKPDQTDPGTNAGHGGGK